MHILRIATILTAAALLVFGLAACGSDDDGDDGDNGAGPTATPPPAADGSVPNPTAAP